MRLLVASGQWFPDFKGGSARVVTDTARRLADRGHDVTILAPRVGGEPEEQREGTLVLRRVLARNPLPNTFTDVFETRRHARRARPAEFDVLLGHQSTTTSGLWAAKLNAPLVRVFHAAAALELRFARPRLGWGLQRLATYGLVPTLAAWETLALRRSDRILVLSEFSRSILQELEPGVMPNVRQVSGGVDGAYFSPGDGQGSAREVLGVVPDVRLLVTVRRLESRMGLSELLHAVELVRDPDLVLSVVGDGSLRGELEALATKLGLGSRVRFTGRVPDAELREWYRAADLFVLPTVAYEGFGMVTAEALATGLPVVGTPVGATPELLGPLDNRLLAESTEPDALAASISDALSFSDRSYRRRCREYALARFDWDVAIESWQEALLEVVGAPSTFDSASLDVSGARL